MNNITRFCHICKYHNPPLDYCQRCKSKLHQDDAKEQTLAWLLSAVMFYIPANIYPIMITSTLFQETESNILQGVIVLWQQQSYLVAMIILFASIIVPIVKMSIIFLLLIGNKNKQREHNTLYILVEKIGRWSMIDVFVVVVLTVIVQIDNIVSIIPGVAIVSFALSVICSIVAVKYLSIKVSNEN